MYRLAAAFGTSLTEVHLTPEIFEFLSDVLKLTRNVDVTQEAAPQTHVDQDWDLSQIESCLDGGFSCNSAKDGPPVHQWGTISDVQQRPIQSDEWTDGTRNPPPINEINAEWMNAFRIQPPTVQSQNPQWVQ